MAAHAQAVNTRPLSLLLRNQGMRLVTHGTRLSTQGVVTYTSPVEAFATGIKNLDR